MEAPSHVTDRPSAQTRPPSTASLASQQGVLRRLYEQLRGEMSRRFKRHVSFGDLFTDRWETATNLGFGAGTSCYDNVLVLGDVQVGERCWIGPNVVLDGSGGLVIGDDCTISAGAQVYSHSTAPDRPGLRRDQQPRQTAPTRLGDRVYLSPNVVVAMGVTIGDDVTVGALSFVNRDVPTGATVWGAPARSHESAGQAGR